jgi:hypothetical protein
MSIEDEIVAFVRERHAPEAIIVVGSRADGAARTGCDWDLYALCARLPGDPKSAVPAPAEFCGELLDIALVELPVPDERILAVFGPNLQHARILLDREDGIANRLCERAAELYARGRGLTQFERDARRHDLLRNLRRMEARADQPGAFFEALTYFFYLAHRSWYEVLHDRWSQSVHRALPEIAQIDPAFHHQLEVLMGDLPAKARVVAARAIARALFPGQMR